MKRDSPDNVVDQTSQQITALHSTDFTTAMTGSESETEASGSKAAATAATSVAATAAMNLPDNPAITQLPAIKLYSEHHDPQRPTGNLNLARFGTAVNRCRIGGASNSIADRHLQLGDEISLISDQGGLLFADGHVKKRAFVLDNCVPRLASSGDQMKSVFRIEPQLAYRENKAYRQVIHNEIDGDLFYNDVLHRQNLSKDSIDSVYVEQLKQAAILEDSSNHTDFLRLRGTTVMYGMIVQLFNMHTKRYLTVNSRETCYNEPTAMPIDLERNLRRECLFRIMPKFRIRTEGEPVRIGDVVVFRSVATEAHLNTAKFKFANTVAMLPITGQGYIDSEPMLEIREASASMAQHGWKMSLFRSAQTAEFVTAPQSPHAPIVTLSVGKTSDILQTTATNSQGQNSRIIQGGKFIRLYHKEKNGYLSCPSFVSLADSTFEHGGLNEHKVQLLEYSFDPLNPQDSSSCLTMWQVEIAADFLNGEAIEWGVPVRLRHAASNMYLSVRRDYNFPINELTAGNISNEALMVDLTPTPGSISIAGQDISGGGYTGLDGEDPTVFVFVQVNAEHNSAISTGIYLRIQHVATGSWLHPVRIQNENINSSGNRTSQQRGIGESGFQSISKQKNTYFFVASYEQFMDDYFTISMAEPELVDKFNYVHSMLPWLVQFVVQPRYSVESKNGAYPIKSKEDRTLRMILSAMIFFCTKSSTTDPFKREGTPILVHQTLLRETSIIDVLLKFLKFPFSAGDSSLFRTSLLELEIGKSSENIRKARSRPNSPLRNNVDAVRTFSARPRPISTPSLVFSISGPETDRSSETSPSNVSSLDSPSTDNISMVTQNTIHGATENFLRNRIVMTPRIDTKMIRKAGLSQSTEFNMTGRLTEGKAVIELRDIKNGSQEALARIFRFIYRVLKQFLLGSEHNNQSHLADKFMILSEHIDLNVGAADALMQLIDGNPLIVQKIKESQIVSFIDLLARDRNPSYVNFLIAMCYCDGVAMPAHQLTIAERLLGSRILDEVENVTNESQSNESSSNVTVCDKNNESSFPLHLFKTRVTEKQTLEVFPATERVFRRWLPLDELCAKELSTSKLIYQQNLSRKRTMSSHSTRNLSEFNSLSPAAAAAAAISNKTVLPNRPAIAEYFEATLKLYKALCLGQNTKVIDLLTNKWKIISLEECKIGLYDENIPDKIRSLYADLIRVVFIDKFPITWSVFNNVFPLESISSRPIFSDILKASFEQNTTSDSETLFMVAGWTTEFLETQSVQIAENGARNHFVLSTLRLMKSLIQFGLIRDETKIKKVFRVLMKILDGKTDLRDAEMKGLAEEIRAKTSWNIKDRFEFNEQTQPIIHSKIEICMIMELLLQLRLEMRAYLFFHYWHEYYKPDGKRTTVPEYFITLKSNLAFGFKNIQTLLSSIMDETSYFRLRDILTPILLELLQYESPRLKQCSVLLLHRLFSSIEELLEVTKNAVILNDQEHISSYQWIKNQISIFKENGVGTAAASDNLPGTVMGGIPLEIAKKMKLLLDDFGELCVTGSKVTGISLIDTVIKSPRLLEVIPDTITQVEIRNLGIHNWVITMLKNRLSHSVAQSLMKSDQLRQPSASLVRSVSADGSVDSRFSEDSIYDQLTDIPVKDSSEPIETLTSVQSDILLSAFEFLFKFANENRIHQAIIFEHFDLLIESTNPRLSGANLQTSFSCVQVLGKMLQQNIETCLRIGDQHILQILELSHGRRPEYINLLRSLIRVEGKVLKRNQSLVMKHMLENRKTYINLNTLLQRFKFDLSEDIFDGRRSEELSNTISPVSLHSFSNVKQTTGNTLEIHLNRRTSMQRSPINRSASNSSNVLRKSELTARQESVPLEYFEDVLSLLAECCEEKNYMMQLVSFNLQVAKIEPYFTLQMCQTVISVSEILALLNSESAPLPLKNSLALLLVTAYMEATGEEDTEKHPERIQKDSRAWKFLTFVLIIAQNFNQALVERNIIENDAENFLFSGGLRFVEGFFKNCVISASFDGFENTETIENLIDCLSRLAKLTENNSEKFDRVVAAVRAICDFGFEGKKYRGTEYDNFRIGKFPNFRSSSVQLANCEKTSEYIKDQNVILVNKSIMEILNKMSSENVVKIMMEKEFKMLAKKFTLIVDKKMPPNEFKDMCASTKSIIEYLEQSAQGIVLQTISTLKRRHKKRTLNSSFKEDMKYDIKTLKILESLVTEEIAVVDNIDRGKHPDKWQKAENHKIQVQKLLNQLGCTLMAERLLTSDRGGVFTSSLRTLIVLLDGGNKEIQDTLENYWLGTREERFFYCIHEAIKKFIIQVRETKQQSDSQAISNASRLSGTSLSNTMLNLNYSTSQTSIDEFGSMSSISQIRAMNDNDYPSVAGSGGSEDGEYSAIRSVMRLLQLLVEGHNFHIQEYMRIQPDNIKTFNLIRQVVDFLHAVIVIEDIQVIPVVIQVFDTLIDLSQGCTQNQVTIFQSKIVSAVNYILLQEYKNCSKDQILELKGKAALSLLSLLEDDAEENNRNVFKQMAVSFDLRALLLNLRDATLKLVNAEEESKRLKMREAIRKMTQKEEIAGLIVRSFKKVKESSNQFLVGAFGRKKKIEKAESDEYLVADTDSDSYTPRGSIIPAIRDSTILFELASKFSSIQVKQSEKNSSEVLANPMESIPRRPSHESFASIHQNEMGDDINEEEENDDDETSSPRETAYIYSMLIATLFPYMSPENQYICERNVAFNTFNNKTGRIEIVRELNNATEKRLYTVLFPIPDICFNIKDYTKDRFLWMRKRNTPQEKIEDFIHQSQDIIYEIRNQSRVEENLWLKMLAQGHSYWWWGAYLLSLMINVGNMLCMIAPTGDVEYDDFSKCPALVDHGRTVLGLIQICFW
ncbi:hypothetical protein HK100_001428, partial [Physocladia obscura]